MKTEQLLSRFTPIATTQPILFIDSTAPLTELHACASERLHATLDYLTLMACATLRDSAENDVNTITNIARIMVQDISDIFGVIEQRGLEMGR